MCLYASAHIWNSSAMMRYVSLMSLFGVPSDPLSGALSDPLFGAPSEPLTHYSQTEIVRHRHSCQSSHWSAKSRGQQTSELLSSTAPTKLAVLELNNATPECIDLFAAHSKVVIARLLNQVNWTSSSKPGTRSELLLSACNGWDRSSNKAQSPSEHCRKPRKKSAGKYL